MTKTKAHFLAESGSSGLKQSNGIIEEEFHKDLKGGKAVKVYKEMRDNEPMVAIPLLIAELLMRQSKRILTPAENSDRGKYWANFIDECFDDIEGGFSGFMSGFFTCATYGWALMEKVYKLRRGRDQKNNMLKSKYNDGKIGLRKIGLRSQDSLGRWEFSPTGEILGMIQNAPPDYRDVFIPIEKCALFRIMHTKNNPEGYSLLRPVYIPYYSAKMIKFFESVGIERDLAGYPVMEVPPQILHPNASSAEKAVRSGYEDMVRKIKRDQYEGVVIPSETDTSGNPTGYKLRLLSSGGKRPVDTDVVIKRYETRMVQALLSSFVMLGQNISGSHALSSDQTDMFGVALDAILMARDDVINESIIPELCLLNGCPPELIPKMGHGDVEAPKLVELAQYVATLSSAGVIVPDDQLEKHLRETGNLPVADEATERTTPGPVAPF